MKIGIFKESNLPDEIAFDPRSILSDDSTSRVLFALFISLW